LRAASLIRSAQYGHSVFDGGTSFPHCGQTQLNISTPLYTKLCALIGLCITTVLVPIQFQYRDASRPTPSRIALFPGAWNPPTVAHAAIARAALEWADEVIWILPKAFPHKGWEGLDIPARLEMLRRVAMAEPSFSVALAQGGLYFEMAEEARDFFGSAPEIGLLCGRDAAERIAGWDYGTPGVFDQMIELYPLLVAARAGHYEPAQHQAGRIIHLAMPPEFDEVSSSEVRRRIAANEAWRHLVPDQIVALLNSGSFDEDGTAQGSRLTAKTSSKSRRW
jgi:nicotinic acid mononucleotide adenylyltransferase